MSAFSRLARRGRVGVENNAADQCQNVFHNVLAPRWEGGC